jgi:predicted permease
VSLKARWRLFRSRPYLAVIAIVGAIVPSRLRAEWRQEWAAELRCRERRLARWGRLDRRNRRDLLRRSAGAIWDALWLQRQRWEDEMVQDVRFAFRMLIRQPAIAIIAIATLALGIGANTAVFSFVNALLLRPLDGVARPGQLVQIGRQYPDKSYLSDSSYPEFLDLRANSTTLSGIAALAPAAFHLSAGGATERVEGERVTGDYFAVLGVTAAQGRLLSPGDDLPTAEPVAVISARLWRRRFGGSTSIPSATIKLDGHDFAVIGVASENFTGVSIGTPRDVWVPLAALHQLNPNLAARFGQRRPSWLEMFGRLAPDATLEQARAELSAIARRLEQSYPDSNTRVAIGVHPGVGRDVQVQNQIRRFALLPFTAVAIVLLIASANVAGLLLARAAARRKEIATRLALGAGRIRVIRQLLTESLILAMAGGAAGLLVGTWLTSGLRSLLPERYLFLSFNLDFGVDWRVFAFTMAVATATGVLFGLAPALHASRPDLMAHVKDPQAFGRRRGPGARGALVVVEVALSLILLVAAALCIRTLGNTTAIDTGYRPAPVLTGRIDLPRQRYAEASGRLFQQQLIERLEAVPGVGSAGFAVTLPLNDGRWEDAVRRQGDGTRFQTFQNVISPQYFEVMSIPLLLGRQFTALDDERAPRVAILNQALARMMWPGENPLGKRLTFSGASMEVVGTVKDIKGRNLFETPGPMLYVPLWQQYQPNVVLHVRAAAGPAAGLIPALGAEVAALDKDLPLYAVRPLDEHVTATLTPQRLLAYLVSAFGVLALVLATIGLYALLAYTVSERTQEIGIRVALGAQKRDVMRLFVAWGIRLAIAGIAVGLAGAAGLTRLMKSVLFGVSPLDPLTLTTMPVLLFAAALLACWIPAYRAARADPKIALRQE